MCTSVYSHHSACVAGLSTRIAYTFPDFCTFTTTDPTVAVQYLAKYGPAAISVDASNWNTLACGTTVLSDPFTCNSTVSNHAVVLTGWGMCCDIGL